MIVYMKIFLFDLLFNKIGYHGDSKKIFLIQFFRNIYFIYINNYFRFLLILIMPFSTGTGMERVGIVGPVCWL